MVGQVHKVAFVLRYERDIAMPALVSLYEAVGWTAYTAEPYRLKSAVSNSAFVVTAWADGQLVGLLRVVSDDVSVAYYQDLVVHPSARRRGLASQLLEACHARFHHVRRKVLVTYARDVDPRVLQSAGFRDTRRVRGEPVTAWLRYEDVDLD